MPVFAALFWKVVVFFGGLASNIMWYIHFVDWARRAFIVALGVAFLAAVTTCVSGLLSALSGSGLPSRFLMGLGMFIPSNASAVLSCVATVWLACVVYRLKLEAIRW